MLELHVCNRNGAVLRAFALGDTTEVIVGRDESCDVRIEAPTVSREHCLIEQQAAGSTLRDLDSSGGTYVGSQRIDSVPITNGLEVRVGPAVLRFVETAL